MHAVLDALPASAAGAVLVMKSTVPAGTGTTLRHALDERGLVDVAYASNPEFLREGTAVRDFAEPDRVVIGADDPAVAERIAALYAPIAEHIVRTDVTSSEMIKLASNAFLATKISFINEVANVCEVVGATIDEVARGMGLDRRIGASFLRPGIGFGGSCFPKDVSALKQLAGNTGYHFQLLASVIEVNELQKRRVIGKLKHHLDSLRDRRIALLGLAFKPDTNDMREASSVVLAARLLGEGAQVVAFDPAIDAGDKRGSLPREVELCSSPEEAATGADAVVIVTEWPEFAAPVLDGTLLACMRTPLIVDGRNLLDPAAVRAAGYTYEGVGRPAGGLMDAVVLVGGSGTRLRPLTLRTPKPMLPLVDRPLLAYLFDQLAAGGVDARDPRLRLPARRARRALRRRRRDRLGPRARVRRRARAARHRRCGASRRARPRHETFLLLNGDILSEHDLARARRAASRAQRGRDALARAGRRSVALRRRRARGRRHRASASSRSPLPASRRATW